MRKIFLLSILFTPIILFAQNPYYDALYLKERGAVVGDKFEIKIKTEDRQKFRDVFIKYVKNVDELNALDQVLSVNPFISYSGESKLENRVVDNFTDQTLKFIEGLDITTIANGAADLMIERAKEELTISFFNKLKKYSEKHPEFQTLFPKTADNLINLLAHTYPQMLPVLRSGFHDDLSMLVYHLEDVLSLPKYKPILDEFPEIKVFVQLLGVIKGIEEKKNAAEIIDDISKLSAWDAPISSDNFKNAASAVKLANIISQSLRNNSTDKIWVSSTEIKTLIKDGVLFKIYLGLIYQQVSKEGLQSVASSIKNNEETIFLIETKLKDFGIISSKVEETIGEIKRKKSAGKITNEDYYNYINTSLDAIDFVFGVVKVFDSKLTPDKYLSVARKSNTIYKNIYLKNYAAAIVDVVDVFDEMETILKEEKSRLSTGHDSEFKSLCSFLNKVRPFAVFIAGVADAKSSDDVKVALENAILPVGSSSIKKYTKNNLSIQSYLGAYWTPNASSDVSNAWSNRFGVIAPIGLSYTPGFLSWKKGGSLSLFVPLFDIGAIVDYKLKQETVITDAGTTNTVVSKDYSIKLGQIVSPGAYLVYGSFCNLPLALGGGFQYGPGLSKIDAGNNPVIGNPSLRWNVFLAVDLPFFNLVNKTKYRK